MSSTKKRGALGDSPVCPHDMRPIGEQTHGIMESARVPKLPLLFMRSRFLSRSRLYHIAIESE